MGIVDGHAYTVLACIDNAGDSGLDLVKVRNPWKRGEITSGMWADDGPGWDEHPEVKDFCQPVKADDGIFWMNRDEFYTYFPTVYLCAHDMTVFRDPDEEFDCGC